MYWMGPRCRFYDGKCGHYGEERHKCNHQNRQSLNGWFGRLFNSNNCIMTVWDDESYCPLFDQMIVCRPEPPKAIRRR